MLRLKRLGPAVGSLHTLHTAPGLQGIVRDGYGRLVVGDVIVGLHGKPVKSEADLFGGCQPPASQPCLAVAIPACHPQAACLPSRQPGPASSSPSLFPTARPLTPLGVPPCSLLPTDILDGCKVGETVAVEVLRGGRQKKTLMVQLAERQLEPSE